jgi:hypothetical protein
MDSKFCVWELKEYNKFEGVLSLYNPRLCTFQAIIVSVHARFENPFKCNDYSVMILVCHYMGNL